MALQDCTPKPGRVEIHLAPHGIFIAAMEAVQIRMMRQSRRELLREIFDTWPEMLERGDWTKAYLHSLDTYILAIILCQI